MVLLQGEIMLKPAILYKEALAEKAKVVLSNPEKYQFMELCNYLCYDTFVIDDVSEWAKIKRVSINGENEVLGFMKAAVCRQDNSVSELLFVNFNLHKLSITFVRDMEIFLQYLLKMFRKVSFVCVVGNPAERLYDKVIEKYHGRVVGIKKQEALLQDGQLYDLKLYEIVKE